MFWCNLGFHKWPKWSTPNTVSGREQFFRRGVPISNWEKVSWEEQNRTCERCGKYEFRKVDE